MRVAAGEGQEQRDGRPERRDLRQREVDEDDAALHDVHTQIRVDARQDEAGGKRRGQELQDHGVDHLPPPSA